MQRGTDVFANDVVYGREIELRKLKHRQHVAAVKPTSQTNARDRELDQRMPESLSPRYDHLRFNPKRIEMESEYYHRVNHQNKVLLERMIKISRTNSLLPKDPPRFQDHREHNERVRRRRMHKVYEENAALGHRIQNVRPSYPKKEWSRVSAHQTRLLKKLTRDRTLGFLSSAPQPRRSNRNNKRNKHSPRLGAGAAEAAGVGGRANQAWGSPRAAAANAGLYVDLDAVPGGHLWGGPSIQSTRGNWNGRPRRKSPRESKRHHRRAREAARWNEKQWNTSTSLRDPRVGSYEAAYEKASLVFDTAGYMPFNAGPSAGFRGVDQMPPTLPRGRGPKRKGGRGRRRQHERNRAAANAMMPQHSYDIGVCSTHEELLFQGQKEVHALEGQQGQAHVASITVFELTEQTFREESVASVNGGGSSLGAMPSTISNSPVHLPVTAQSLGLRVVACLTPPSPSFSSSNDPSAGQGRDEIVVVQHVGLRYLVVVLSTLARNASDDQESRELASVARDVLQKLAERDGSANAQGPSLRGILGGGAAEEGDGVLLQRFAQLLMHICETELHVVTQLLSTTGVGATSQRRSSCLVVGRRHCGTLHEQATRIQALTRGVMSRTRMFQMLRRVQKSENRIMEKEVQRRHRDRSRSPQPLRGANTGGSLKLAREAADTKHQQRQQQQQQQQQQPTGSAQPTRPRPGKTRPKLVRPSNRPGRERAATKKVAKKKPMRSRTFNLLK